MKILCLKWVITAINCFKHAYFSHRKHNRGFYLDTQHISFLVSKFSSVVFRNKCTMSSSFPDVESHLWCGSCPCNLDFPYSQETLQVSCIAQDYCFDMCVPLWHEGCHLAELMQRKSFHPFTASRRPAGRCVAVTAGHDEPPPAAAWLFRSHSFTPPKRDEQYRCLTQLTSSPPTLSCLSSCGRDRFQ